MAICNVQPQGLSYKVPALLQIEMERDTQENKRVSLCIRRTMERDEQDTMDGACEKSGF